MVRATLSIVTLLFATSVARADDVDRFLEAQAAKDWEHALAAWDGVLEATAHEPGTDLVLKHADVALHAGKRQLAREDAQSVLEKEPENIVALAFLARLRAGEHADEAKALLLEAGREGYPVFREVRASAELKELGDDPVFVLAAMRASSQFDARGEHPRNPFLPSRLREPTGTSRRQVPYTIAEKDRSGRLEHYILLGNEHLREMMKLLRDEKLAEVSVRFQEVKSLCEQMRKEPEEDFARNADEIERRASRLDAEARKLLRVKELGIVVTGIVVAPSVKSRAIIALGDRTGSIYEVGDELRDPSGERVRGLQVARIAEGVVGFRYEGVDFVRDLKRGP